MGSPPVAVRVTSAVLAFSLLIAIGVLARRLWAQSHPELYAAAGPIPAVGAQRARLATSTLPAPIGSREMYVDALLDLDTLNRAHGVTVAAWTPVWRYVWPRDAAFVASALARTGRLDEAAAQLDFLQ